MADILDQVIEYTIDVEGFETIDEGGYTRFGISQRWNPEIDVASLDRAGAHMHYRRKYAEPFNFTLIEDKALLYKVFNIGVNIDPVQSIRYLQTAANYLGAELKVDGLLGPVSLEWINNYRHPRALLMAYQVVVGNHYFKQDNPSKIAGWMNRLEQRVKL